MINEAFSNPALGLIKIVCAFGNYNKKEIVFRCLTKSNRRINRTTVENVLQEIRDEYEEKVVYW